MKIKKAILVLGCLPCLALPLRAQDVYRVWRNREGVAIQAHYVSADAETVTIKMINGTQHVVKLDTLSQVDQDFVAQKRGGGARGGVASARHAEWKLDLDEALAESKSTGLPVLILFTGSDWCPPCMNLEKNVLGKSSFQKFANERVVLMKVDKTRKRPPPKKLADKHSEWMAKYGVTGYPSLVLVDAEGKQFQKFGYGGQDDGKFIEQVGRYLDSAPKK